MNADFPNPPAPKGNPTGNLTALDGLSPFCATFADDNGKQDKRFVLIDSKNKKAYLVRDHSQLAGVPPATNFAIFEVYEKQYGGK
jgi:hypothetical protein